MYRFFQLHANYTMTKVFLEYYKLNNGELGLFEDDGFRRALSTEIVQLAGSLRYHYFVVEQGMELKDFENLKIPEILFIRA